MTICCLSSVSLILKQQCYANFLNVVSCEFSYKTFLSVWVVSAKLYAIRIKIIEQSKDKGK